MPPKPAPVSSPVKHPFNPATIMKLYHYLKQQFDLISNKTIGDYQLFINFLATLDEESKRYLHWEMSIIPFDVLVDLYLHLNQETYQSTSIGKIFLPTIKTEILSRAESRSYDLYSLVVAYLFSDHVNARSKDQQMAKIKAKMVGLAKIHDGINDARGQFVKVNSLLSHMAVGKMLNADRVKALIANELNKKPVLKSKQADAISPYGRYYPSVPSFCYLLEKFNIAADAKKELAEYEDFLNLLGDKDVLDDTIAHGDFRPPWWLAVFFVVNAIRLYIAVSKPPYKNAKYAQSVAEELVNTRINFALLPDIDLLSSRDFLKELGSSVAIFVPRLLQTLQTRDLQRYMRRFGVVYWWRQHLALKVSLQRTNDASDKVLLSKVEEVFKKWGLYFYQESPSSDEKQSIGREPSIIDTLHLDVAKIAKPTAMPADVLGYVVGLLPKYKEAKPSAITVMLDFLKRHTKNTKAEIHARYYMVSSTQAVWVPLGLLEPPAPKNIFHAQHRILKLSDFESTFGQNLQFGVVLSFAGENISYEVRAVGATMREARENASCSILTSIVQDIVARAETTLNVDAQADDDTFSICSDASTSSEWQLIDENGDNLLTTTSRSSSSSMSVASVNIAPGHTFHQSGLKQRHPNANPTTDTAPTLPLPGRTIS